MVFSAEDVVAIQQLCARYNRAVDTGDGAGFAAMFRDGGTLNGRGTIAGREALAAFATKAAASLASPHHVVTNVVVDGDGDTAKVTAYLQVWANVGEAGTPALITTGQYMDDLVREDGVWLFASRVFTSDRS
jgi:uncharacterized protein (TIGR02246 family)